MPGVADSAVQFGLSQIGLVYRTGADFTAACYLAAGVHIPPYVLAQAYRVGEPVPLPTRSPGDLVFPTARIVQLYLGGDQVLAVAKVAGGRHVGRYRLPGRVWRVVRVTTPGGGAGLSLAKPGESLAKPLAGRRP